MENQQPSSNNEEQFAEFQRQIAQLEQRLAQTEAERDQAQAERDEMAQQLILAAVERHHLLRAIEWGTGVLNFVIGLFWGRLHALQPAQPRLAIAAPNPAPNLRAAIAAIQPDDVRPAMERLFDTFRQ